MSIRILHVIGSMRLGGAQVCLKNLVDIDNSKNFTNFVYPLRPKGTRIEINCETIFLDYPNYDPRKFFAILNICKKYDIDIIHAHLDKPIILGILVKIFCKRKLIVHDHGALLRNDFKAQIYRWFLKLFKNIPDRYFIVSKVMQERLINSIGPEEERIELVYNPFNNKKFNPLKYDRDLQREKFNIAKTDVTIGFIGRLDFVKGFDIALDAFKKIYKENKNAKFIIAGEGCQKKLLDDIDSALNGRILYLGYYDNTAEIMSVLDCALLPSRRESFGITAVELMAMSVPMICSGIDGLKEITEHKKTALIAENNNPDEYAFWFKELASNSHLRNQIRSNASKNVRKFYQENYINRVHEIYSDLLHDASSRS